MTISKKTNCCAVCRGPVQGRSPRTCSARSAFTLIELLLVISVIAVLSTLAVGMMASAQNDARLSATRSRIQVIQSAMEVELEDYEVRRSPVPIENIVALANAMYGSSDRLKAKNLKRMIIADLIRTEFPNGESFQDVGEFPSLTLQDFIKNAGTAMADDNDIRAAFGDRIPANVNRWNGSGVDNAADLRIEASRANNSEYLYKILSQLDYEGSTVVDALGARAVGDSDGDGSLEVIDGFGDPIYFQFHQRNIVEDDATAGTWKQQTPDMATFNTAKPVLPTEIRFYLSSENLLEVDGLPIDL